MRKWWFRHVVTYFIQIIWIFEIQHLMWVKCSASNFLCFWKQFNKILLKFLNFSKLLQSCLTLWDPVTIQPTRLLCSWDFPGKNSGVGCHALLQGIPRPRMKPVSLISPALARGFFTTSTTWETLLFLLNFFPYFIVNANWPVHIQ